jgi:ABC-2 type transport system permease protein
MSELQLAITPPQLWPSVWKLLRLRALIFLSGFRRAKTRRKIVYIVLVIIGLAFLGFLFFISWALLQFLRSPELAQYVENVTPFLNSVPVLIIGGAFLGILLTSFGVLLQALYLAGDMDFLLSAPIPLRGVFLTKLLQAILPNFSLISIFALPVLFGLGFSGHYNLLYYPLTLVMLAALALAAAGLSSLLVMFVVRIFPARRVAEVLGFFGALISFICSQSGQLARFDNISQSQASQALNAVQRFNSPWSPLAWAGRGLVDIGEGRWLSGLGFSGLSLGLAVLVFVFALSTAERLYYSGWARMQSKPHKKKVVRAARPEGARPLAVLAERLIPVTIRAVIVKDALVLQRDLRNLSQLVTPLIFGIIYAFMFLRGGTTPPGATGNASALFSEVARNIFIYGNVGISLFVGWMLLARLGGMGFSHEGKSYWVIKSSPVRSGQLIVAKYLVAFIPALALGWGFLLVMSLVQQAEISVVLFSLVVVALCIAGNAGLNLTFGILGANMNWDDPRHMQRGGSGCLGSLASVVYLPLSLLLFFGPPLLFKILQWPEGIGQLVGLALGGVFGLVVATLPLYLVRNRVMLLGES